MELGTVTRLALETSVSFGRFNSDNLSWEKWSSFSPNRYLEEVEKCATPGSVASKKAFFESRYKKAPPKEPDAPRSDQNDPVCPADCEFVDDVVEVEAPTGEESEAEEGVAQFYVKSKETEEEAAQFSAKSKETEEEIAQFSVKSKEAEEEVAQFPVKSKEAEEDVQKPVIVDVGVAKIVKKEVKKAQDRVVSSRKSVSVVKKPLAKERIKPSPKQKDPKASPTIVSKQRTPKQRTAEVNKKEQRSAESLPRKSSKMVNKSSSERKKIPALHKSVDSSISLNLRSENRKPLIMETMKDKEIVRRAFKSFQKALSEPDAKNPKLAGKSPSKTKVSAFN